jgi:hypothetical protein
MVADRRYGYGDPRSPSRFFPAWYFVGSIGSPAAGKSLTNQPLTLSRAFQVGGCGRLGSEDAILDRQPHEHNAIEEAVERPPPETTDRFEHLVRDFADDFGRM